MKNTKKLVIGGLLIAVNILLPYLLHFIPNGGKLFLPMHLGVMIAGLLLGPVYGTVIGVVSPLLGFLFTNMPPMPMAVYMMFELAAYGACAGVFLALFRRTGLPETAGLYLSLIGSMIVGRLVYAGVLLFSGMLAFEKAPAVITVFTSFLSGIPGVIVQLILVPLIVTVLNKQTKPAAKGAV